MMEPQQQQQQRQQQNSWAFHHLDRCCQIAELVNALNCASWFSTELRDCILLLLISIYAATTLLQVHIFGITMRIGEERREERQGKELLARLLGNIECNCQIVSCAIGSNLAL